MSTFWLWSFSCRRVRHLADNLLTFWIVNVLTQKYRQYVAYLSTRSQAPSPVHHQHTAAALHRLKACYFPSPSLSLLGLTGMERRPVRRLSPSVPPPSSSRHQLCVGGEGLETVLVNALNMSTICHRELDIWQTFLVLLSLPPYVLVVFPSLPKLRKPAFYRDQGGHDGDCGRKGGRQRALPDCGINPSP